MGLGSHSCITVHPALTPAYLLYMQLHEATGKSVHVLLPDEVEYSRAVVM
jgi:hypothetical protein